MSRISIVDYNDTDTLKCMGTEILDIGDLTDDEEDEILCSVTTMADLDLAKFEQLLVETGCQDGEEGQIVEQVHRNQYQPYPSHLLHRRN